MTRSKAEDLEYEDYGYSRQKKAEDFDSFAIKLPEGMTLFKIDQAGKYQFDILPYRAGDINRHARPGKLYWQLSYYVHKRIGPDAKDVCCLRKMWNEPCPVCEQQADMRRKMERSDQAAWDAQKELDAKDRQLFLVIDRTVRGPDVQLLENSYALFGKMLDAKLDANPVKYAKFWHGGGGMTVIATFEKGSMGKGSSGTFQKCNNIELVERDKDIPVELIKALPCLDDLLVKHSYDKVYGLLHGVSGEKETNGRDDRGDDEPGSKRGCWSVPENDEPKTNRKVAEPEPDDDEPVKTPAVSKGDFVLHRKLGRCEVVRVSSDGTSLTLLDEGGDSHRAIDADEVKVAPDKEDVKEETKKPAGRKPREEPPTDDGWGDDEPKKPAKPRK